MSAVSGAEGLTGHSGMLFPGVPAEIFGRAVVLNHG